MHRKGVSPSGHTFSSVLKACAHHMAILEGKQVHTMLLQSGCFDNNKFVQTALLHMYAKFGCIDDARHVFDVMVDDNRDVVARSAMISGYAKMGLMDNAHKLFGSMDEKDRDIACIGSMVAGYAHCGNMESARELYDRMVEKDSNTILTMIAGYGECGLVDEAKKMFDQIEIPDYSCWAAMVACYSKNGSAKEAIDMYKTMREERVITSEVAVVAAISACTQLGDIVMGTTLAEHVEEGCCHRTIIVSNALIDMYAKCGSMERAWREFDRMKERDVISYTTMIGALADHGESEKALDLFSTMQKEGIQPNKVSFIVVLSACSRGGFIEEGCRFYDQMTQVSRINLSAGHITCIVELLGKAGHLEKAYKVMMENVGDLDAGVWNALLGACKVHGNDELGEIAAKHLFELEPDNKGNYLALASIYASVNKWNDVNRIVATLRAWLQKVFSVTTVWNQLKPAYAANLWNEAWNKRLGTKVF
ncbi:hypothetical protein ACFE04_008417 [Oxalis oulophora]